jgi:hypothetical protein
MRTVIFILLSLTIVTSVHATLNVNGESTPGTVELFQNFSSCQLSTFSHIEKNIAVYGNLGKFKKMGNEGSWFDTKQVDKNSVREIYRFKKPLKIYGLTVVAAGYSFYKADDSFGDATYWGFYFAESPREIYQILRNKYQTVADMLLLEPGYVNMKVLQKDGDKLFDQGSILEEDTTQEGVKSYFNCSIQYKIIDK